MNYFDGDANLLCGCDIENQNREDSIDERLEKYDDWGYNTRQNASSAS